MAKKGIAGILYEMLNDAVMTMSADIKRQSGSSALANSFTPSVQVQPNLEYECLITTTKGYFDFYDKGVRGSSLYNGVKRKSKNNAASPYFYKDKQPPIKAIKGWADKKGINPYALSHAIWRDGTPKHDYISKGIAAAQSPSNMQNLADAISLKMAEQIQLTQ